MYDEPNDVMLAVRSSCVQKSVTTLNDGSNVPGSGFNNINIGIGDYAPPDFLFNRH